MIQQQNTQRFATLLVDDQPHCIESKHALRELPHGVARFPPASGVSVGDRHRRLYASHTLKLVSMMLEILKWLPKMIEHCWTLRGRGKAVSTRNRDDAASKSELTRCFDHEYTTENQQFVVVQNEIARVTWASDNVIGDVVVTREGDVCCDG